MNLASSAGCGAAMASYWSCPTILRSRHNDSASSYSLSSSISYTSGSLSLVAGDHRDALRSTFRFRYHIRISSSSSAGSINKSISTKKRNKRVGNSGAASKNPKTSTSTTTNTRSIKPEARPPAPETTTTNRVDVRTLYQNGDPLGRRDLGKHVVKWICQGMKAMASDFAAAEIQGEFAEVKQRMGPGLTFVIQAQPYLNAIPMPVGVEAVCLKACTHYPTLFDHFQRELRDVLQKLQAKSVIENWCETESWKLLKELANSGSIFEGTFLMLMSVVVSILSCLNMSR